MCGPGLKLGVMARSVNLLQPGSLLMPMIPVAMRTMWIRSGPPLGTVLVSKGFAAAGTMEIWVACTATWCHGDIHTRAAAEDHVWVMILL